MQLPDIQENTTDLPSELDNRLSTIKATVIECLIKTNALFLPSRFKAKTLENFNGFANKIGMALKSIQSEKSLFLSGCCGSGKTHIACGLMYEWYKKKITIREGEIVFPKKPVLLPVVEFLIQLKSTFLENSLSSEEEIISKYAATEFLVLDDIGAEKISDWSRQCLYTLIIQ